MQNNTIHCRDRDVVLDRLWIIQNFSLSLTVTHLCFELSMFRPSATRQQYCCVSVFWVEIENLEQFFESEFMTIWTVSLGPCALTKGSRFLMWRENWISLWECRWDLPVQTPRTVYPCVDRNTCVCLCIVCGKTEKRFHTKVPFTQDAEHVFRHCVWEDREAF